MAELGVEELAVRFCAPPEGLGEPEGAPGGVDGPEGPQKGPLRCDSGGEPTRPAFLEGGAVLRVTDAEANNWPLRALHTALTQWCYRRRNPPPPQPQPPHKQRLWSRAAGIGGGEDKRRGTPHRQARAP